MYAWVFDLDAGERFTPELKAVCNEVVRKDEKVPIAAHART